MTKGEPDKAKILVADDSPQDRQLIEAMLNLEGYEVMTASDGEEALTKLAVEPDLVLLDARMPRLDGYRACLWMKENAATRFIPVVLLVSSREMSEGQQAFEAGADDIIRKPIRWVELRARVGSLLRTQVLRGGLVEGERMMLALAAAIEAQDPYARGHTQKAVDWALSLGGQVGLSPRELRRLRRGAMLHDVGKVAVNPSVLLKREPLTPEDWEEIKAHPVVGARICQPLGQGIWQVVRHHHERWDGQGYPDVLAGEAIPLLARIMALADAYSALTSPRPYRGQLLPQEAWAKLGEEAGKQFDPQLVASFVPLGQAGGLTL